MRGGRYLHRTERAVILFDNKLLYGKLYLTFDLYYTLIIGYYDLFWFLNILIFLTYFSENSITFFFSFTDRQKYSAVNATYLLGGLEGLEFFLTHVPCSPPPPQHTCKIRDICVVYFARWPVRPVHLNFCGWLLVLSPPFPEV